MMVVMVPRVRDELADYTRYDMVMMVVVMVVVVLRELHSVTRLHFGKTRVVCL